MTRIVVPLAILASTLATALPAHATQLTRTFVSSAGSDANPCTVTQPCATFAHAYSVTAASGIIAALDPGKYGPLAISGPITVDGNGWAAITAPVNSVAAITVSAGSTDGVLLHGLMLDGAGGLQTIGIHFTTGGSLTVESCAVRNMTDTGIYFDLQGTTPAMLAVANSSFTGNQGAILIRSQSSGGATASIDRTELSDNFTAVGVSNEGTATIALSMSDSVAANNGTGLFANLTGANSTLTRVQIAGNGTGVKAQGGAKVWLAQSTLSGNTVGFNAGSGGVINTFGDNYLANNGSPIGTLTPANKQ